MASTENAGAPEGASRAAAVFRHCEKMAVGHGGPLQPVAERLGRAAQRLEQPMRLAVAGQIKRGKSTLVNALLGEKVAATGQLELTFTVTEFCYGPAPGVVVHYKDGTREGPLPIGDLEGLTVRDVDQLERLRRIRKVEIALPHELLRTFRLIDTPGLGSVHETDAENTEAFLGVSDTFARDAERFELKETLRAMGRSARDVHEDSVDEIDRADAVLYVFSRGLGEQDYATVAQFLGPGQGDVTPLRAFAVLSNCDLYWPPARDLRTRPDPVDYDPLAAAEPIVDRYMSDQGLRRLFYTMVPVSGLVGIGARQLTAEMIGWLDELRRPGPAALVPVLRDAGGFATRTELPGVRLTTQMRRSLIETLGAWGTFRACFHLSEDGVGETELRERLIADSGITRLRELVAGHFGNRASVIKLDHGLRDVTAEIGRCRFDLQRSGDIVPSAVDRIADEIEHLRTSDHGAAELAVLAAHYNGALTLSAPEVHEVLAVTGEYGTTPAARLGLPEDTSQEQLAQEAQRLANRWAWHEADPALGRADRNAVATVRRSFEKIAAMLTLDA